MIFNLVAKTVVQDQWGLDCAGRKLIVLIPIPGVDVHGGWVCQTIPMNQGEFVAEVQNGLTNSSGPARVQTSFDRIFRARVQYPDNLGDWPAQVIASGVRRRLAGAAKHRFVHIGVMGPNMSTYSAYQTSQYWYWIPWLDLDSTSIEFLSEVRRDVGGCWVFTPQRINLGRKHPAPRDVTSDLGRRLCPGRIQI